MIYVYEYKQGIGHLLENVFNSEDDVEKFIKANLDASRRPNCLIFDGCSKEFFFRVPTYLWTAQLFFITDTNILNGGLPYMRRYLCRNVLPTLEKYKNIQPGDC